MTDSDELSEIRRHKRERLERRLSGDGQADGDSGETSTSTDPVPVRDRDHLGALVDGNEVVLADFYADWCGPCKTMEPALEAVARGTPAVVAKVNVDVRRELSAEYGVRSLPTLVLFAGGEPVERLVGAQGEAALRSVVGRYAT